jgi:hypothetical protein
MPDAVGAPPVHPRKDAKPLAKMREHDDQQKRGAQQLQQGPVLLVRVNRIRNTARRAKAGTRARIALNRVGFMRRRLTNRAARCRQRTL